MTLYDISLLTAFLAGLISFLSPCVLPLIPGYVSFVAGRDLQELAQHRGRQRLTALPAALSFVFGFSLVFIALGASSTLIGRVLGGYRQELSIAAGVVVVLFGLFMMDVVRLGWLMREFRFNSERLSSNTGGGTVLAFLLGLAFAFGWTPCIGPVLGGILTLSAGTADLGRGITLLGVYSAGLGVPFLAAALFVDRIALRLRGWGPWTVRLRRLAGAAMVLMGVAMINGWLVELSYWLLDAFPVLRQIG